MRRGRAEFDVEAGLRHVCYGKAKPVEGTAPGVGASDEASAHPAIAIARCAVRCAVTGKAAAFGPVYRAGRSIFSWIYWICRCP